MPSAILDAQLEPIARRRQYYLRLYGWAITWASLALLGAGWIAIAHRLSWSPGWGIPFWIAAVVGLGLAIGYRTSIHHLDRRALARAIEERHPELDSLLLTAVEQEPDPRTGRLDHLQEQVVRQAFYESQKRPWTNTVTEGQLLRAHLAHGIAAVALVGTLIGMGSAAAPSSGPTGPLTVNVVPGDASVETGSGLTITAEFDGGSPPSDPVLVIEPIQGISRNLLLEQALEDPVFSATLESVEEPFRYHVRFRDQRSPAYEVDVFERPVLLEADAHLEYPPFTGRQPEIIQDTRRVSAIEGTRLRLSMRLNKEVREARLIPVSSSGSARGLERAGPRRLEIGYRLDKSATYLLKLTDEDGRTNATPDAFDIEVLENRRPQLELSHPVGDKRATALEEVRFKGELWDDFGLEGYGLALGAPGGEMERIELGGAAPGQERTALSHLLSLEEREVEPGDVIHYYLWADDIGPDGERRRTRGDLYFLEIRPFEEVFHEGSAASGSGQGQGGGSPQELLELQKKIINATWRLERDESEPEPSGSFQERLQVIEESQGEAHDQVLAMGNRLREGEAAESLSEAREAMSTALEELRQAQEEEDPARISGALAAEREAYQALLRLQSSVYELTQSRSGGQGGGSSGSARQQLDQLELKASEDLYETAREASSLDRPEQKERLEALDKLEDLAKRQKDLNERLKELQTALRESKSEEEAEELRRRLKRLREEASETLEDLDELRQDVARSDSPEMADAESRLDRSRSDLQRAREQLSEGSVSQALATGSRVQKELEAMGEEFREQSADPFAEALQQIRRRVDEVAERQGRIADQIVDGGEGPRRLSDRSEDSNEPLADQLTGQREAVTELLDSMRELSQQAESAEPLLSQQLYDAVRSADRSEGAKQVLSWPLYQRLHDPEQGNLENSLAISGELFRRGITAQAEEVERKARQAIEELRADVEEASEAVLGNETEALRLARRELTDLRDQVQDELDEARAGGGSEDRPPQQEDEASREGNDRSAGDDQQGTGSERARGAEGSEQSGELTRAPSSTEESDETGSQAGGPGRGESASGGSEQAGERTPTYSSDGLDESESEQPGGGGRGGPSDLDELSSGGGGEFEGVDERLLQRLSEGGGGGPLTGEGFEEWIDRLRNVEEMLGDSDLRGEVQRIRARSRAMRSDSRGNSGPPRWDMVQTEIVAPLTELRDRIGEELARRESPDSLVPLDRDPVPRRYSERVRRYYERLGSGQ